MAVQSSSAPAAPAAPLRRFGRFELRALLSKTQRTMLWLAWEPRARQEMLLAIPREKPVDAAAMANWLSMAQTAARVTHPHLAPVLEVSQVEMWPYVAYDRQLGETLDERLARQSQVLPLEAADWVCQVLEGLAYAHDAGHVHRDIQAAHILINANHQLCLLGLEVVQGAVAVASDHIPVARNASRESVEEDLLAVGLLLHRLLTGRPVLDQQDVQAAIQLMQPLGRELVRLGWETPHPIADPLRAIANRATDRQVRQRYHQARSFHRALDGWRTSAAYDNGGPVAVLLDRLQRVGHLPVSTPRLTRILATAGLESQHASALSGLVLEDMALAFELLRRVNNALKQSGSPGSGTMLNMQRAVSMIGLNGLQAAVRSLKPWPGPLSEIQAGVLHGLMRRVYRAALIAQNLCPAGYDAEVVYLITLLQNLGRLLVQYHFPDDAQQIRQLMLPPEPTEDNPHPRSLSEQAAAFAVLGCDLETMAASVGRYWGLDEDVLHMMRRMPPDAPVRAGTGDTDLIRLTCSLANELVDAMGQPESQRQHAVEFATRRYARVLGLGLRDVVVAMQPESARREAQAHLGEDAARGIGDANTTLTAPLDPPDEPVPPPQPSALRRRLAAESERAEPNEPSAPAPPPGAKPDAA